MITFIGLIVIGIIIFVAIGIKNRRFWDLADWVFGSFLALLMVGMASFLVTLGVSGIATHYADKKYTVKQESPLLALQDNTSVSGHFYLGGGSFNGSMQYVYMVPTSEGTQMVTVGVNQNVFVIESDNPKVEIYEVKFSNNILNYFAEPIEQYNRTKLYIPKGSIKYDYNVDLK